MSGLARNHLQVALQCLLGQLADHLTDNDPMAVDKEGFRDASHPIVNSSGTSGVNNVGIRNAILAHKAESTRLCIFKVDAEKDDPLALYALPRGLQERCFLFAGVAPRCPEVQHHRHSLQAYQVKSWSRTGTERG